jgi:threonylcarbamoyladenosine tRNA methylthiotransferase MtaB
VSLDVVSLGCRLNLSESEQLRGLLAASEDLVVINSCAVTAEAVRQTRQAIRRARKARPEARLLVTGCAAEVEREMLAAMPEVDGLVANGLKLDPRSYNAPFPVRPGLVEGLLFTSGTALGEQGQSFDRLRTDGFGSKAGPHTRAFVQVQNGCDHACTFCVIPQGRGPSRSRPIPQVLEDIARHVEAGAHEMVLTGVDLTSWGGDLPGKPKLGQLVAAILNAVPALPRLRLSSLDGIEIDPLLFDLIAEEPRVMPHLHLSLQSGDDLILKRMKRRHSRADAVRLVENLKAKRPDIAIGADIIAGFPTEDEAAHCNNLSIVRELEIVHGHVFPYSRRPGTPATRMPQVDVPTIKVRAAELRAAVAEQRRLWLASQIGYPLEVLAERDGTGHAPHFARVQLPEGSKPGSLVTVTPTRIVEGLLA